MDICDDGSELDIRASDNKQFHKIGELEQEYGDAAAHLDCEEPAGRQKISEQYIKVG